MKSELLQLKESYQAKIETIKNMIESSFGDDLHTRARLAGKMESYRTFVIEIDRILKGF